MIVHHICSAPKIHPLFHPVGYEPLLDQPCVYDCGSSQFVLYVTFFAAVYYTVCYTELNICEYSYYVSFLFVRDIKMYQNMLDSAAFAHPFLFVRES